MKHRTNKAINEDQVDLFNYYAIELLEQIGKCFPTAHEIELVELILKRLSHRLADQKTSKQFT